MESLSRIVLMVERGESAHAALVKALTLARHTGAELQLFLCDTEAYRETNRRNGVPDFRQEQALQRDRDYLRALREGILCSDVAIDVEAAFAPSLVQGIAQKLQRTPAQMVVRALGRADAMMAAFAWQFVRQSRTPLLMTRGRPWQAAPLFAAALNPQLPQGADAQITEMSELLRRGCGAQVEYLIANPDRLPAVIAERNYDLITLALPTADSHALELRHAERLLQAASADVLVLGGPTAANANALALPTPVQFAGSGPS